MLGLTWSGFNGLSGVGILNFLVLQLALIHCGDVSNVYPAKMLFMLSVDALHSIGGNCTCHCFIDDAWISKVGAADEDEKAVMESAVEVTANSRLSCQIKVTDDLGGIVVHIPKCEL